MKLTMIPMSISDQLSDKTITYLSLHLHSKIVKKGQQFLWEGEQLEAVYVILQGYVKVFRLSDEGREQVLAVLKEGDFINAVPALRLQSTNHAYASALNQVVLGKIGMEDFFIAVQEFSDFALFQMRDLAEKLDHATNLVADLSLHSTRQRLIRFLLSNNTPPATVLGWTQEDIAAQIGTVRDVVSRLLGLFAREGLIRIERQRIILLDEQRLRSELEEKGNAT